MKRFIISVPVIRDVEYCMEANTEEEAIQALKNGDEAVWINTDTCYYEEDTNSDNWEIEEEFPEDNEENPKW